MFTQSKSRRSMLDKAIALSLAAMLGFNVLVLAQQLQSAPAFAFTSSEAAARQA